MKITNEEMAYIMNTLDMEVVCYEDYGGFVEYDMSEEHYEMSKRILEKLKGMVGK